MNKTVKLFVFLFFNFLLSLNSILLGQNEVNKTLGLTSGLSFGALKNNVFSPLIYRGIQIPIGVYFRKDNKKSRNQWSLNFQKGTFFSKFDNTVDNLEVFFSYTYLKNIKLDTRSKYYLGGSISNYVGRRKNTIDQIENLNNFSGEFVSSVQLNGLIEYSFTRSRLNNQLQYGLFGFFSGNQFSNFSNVKASLLHAFNMFQLTYLSQYEYQYSSKTNISIGYRAQYFTKPEPLFLGHIKHQIETTISFQF